MMEMSNSASVGKTGKKVMHVKLAEFNNPSIWNHSHLVKGLDDNVVVEGGDVVTEAGGAGGNGGG